MPSRRRSSRYSSSDDDASGSDDSGHSVSCSCAQCRRMALDRHRPGCRCSTCKRKGTGSRRYGKRKRKKKRKKRRRRYSDSDSSSDSGDEVAKDAEKLLNAAAQRAQTAGTPNPFAPPQAGQVVATSRPNLPQSQQPGQGGPMQQWLHNPPPTAASMGPGPGPTGMPPTLAGQSAFGSMARPSAVAGQSSLRDASAPGGGSSAGGDAPAVRKKATSSWGDAHPVQETAPLKAVLATQAEVSDGAKWREHVKQQAKKKERKKTNRPRTQKAPAPPAAAVKWSQSSIVKKAAMGTENAPRTQIASSASLGHSRNNNNGIDNSSNTNVAPPLPPRPTMSQVQGGGPPPPPLPPRPSIPAQNAAHYAGQGMQGAAYGNHNNGNNDYGRYNNDSSGAPPPPPPPRPSAHAEDMYSPAINAMQSGMMRRPVPGAPPGAPPGPPPGAPAPPPPPGPPPSSGMGRSADMDMDHVPSPRNNNSAAANPTMPHHHHQSHPAMPPAMPASDRKNTLNPPGVGAAPPPSGGHSKDSTFSNVDSAAAMASKVGGRQASPAQTTHRHAVPEQQQAARTGYWSVFTPPSWLKQATSAR